jgi:HEAT repeat protein
MKLYCISAIIVFCLAFIPGGSVRAYEDGFYIDVLRFGTDSDITNAFSNLRQRRGEEVNRRVLEAFSENHTEKAYGALVQYIGYAQMDGAAGVLTRELVQRGKNEDYKEAVIATLGQLKAKSSAAALAAVYEDSSTTKRIKKAIIDSLGAIGDRGFEDRLIAIAQNETEDPEIRAHAVLALGEMKSEKAYETVKRILLQPNEAKIARIYATTSVAKIGGPSALDVLELVIDDQTHEVAEFAVNNIAEIGTERGGELLVRALRSDYDKVRYYAVTGLARMKYPAARDILSFKADHDGNEAVRREAKKALEALKENH